ncbi:MAG: Flp pilus assembly complex ATPase component, partial [Gammaproteobacteria bacterium]|nr:Flp pilus assembly complex ATPase component [Gammaproteobacteria bacterium]
MLAGNAVFELLAEADRALFTRSLTEVTAQAGETIIRRGETAPGLYLIRKGRVRIVDDAEGKDPVVLAIRGQGESFGEASLLTGKPTSATIQAAEDVALLRLDPAAVRQLLEGSGDLRQALEQRIDQDREFDFLRTLPFFAGLERAAIQQLLAVISRRQLAAGEFLFHEGDPADAAYIVRSGSIQIIKESADNAELARREPGALLGEMALQGDKARNAAARALEASVVLCLSQQAYRSITAQAPVRELIERQAVRRLGELDTLLYQCDTADGRAALLGLLHSDGGVERYWQRVKQEKQLPEQALNTLAQATGLDYLTPSTQLLVDPDIVRKVPRHYAQTHQVLPVFADRGEVEVLATTPFLGTVPAEMRRLLGAPVSLRLTEPQFLAKLIDTSTAEGEGITGSLSDLDTGEGWEELDSIEDLKDQAQAAPIIKLVNNVFMEAIGRKASDIHIEPYEEGLEVRYRIDGILQVVSTAPRRYQGAIVSRIKIMANLDIAERRIPQDGRIALRLEAKNFDIRVATVPTVFGEGVVMRILDKSSVQIRLTDVGFEPAMLEQWQAMISRPNGVVLVTGPTGSGKTTTLYATLNHVKSTEVKIITAEDPVEYQLHGIKQIQVDNKVNLTFAAALRSMLRLDPDIIMVGEMRDQETAEIGVQAALTGHLVFSTLHTN